jgi:hypothetical protein
LNWSEARERTLFGPDLVKDAEKSASDKGEFEDDSNEAKELS